MISSTSTVRPSKLPDVSTRSLDLCSRSLEPIDFRSGTSIELLHHQVYCQNTEGFVAGTLHWSRYMGDRQFGWLGTRPTCDILIKLDAFTGTDRIGSVEASPLELMTCQLQVMTARYRIGDGKGSTLEDHPLQNLWTGLGSWRTILPRKASDAIVQTFLKYGASVWVLRTNQIG